MSTPSLKEELDRKSVETLSWLMARKESGEISAGVYADCLDTFNMITLGLIDKDISQAVTVEANETRKGLQRSKNKIIEDQDLPIYY